MHSNTRLLQVANRGVIRFRAFLNKNGRGTCVAIVVAIAAQFLSDHYGTPAMLMALLLGISFHFLAESSSCLEGIEFAARNILRIGIGLLGARISVELIISLGTLLVCVIVLAVILTIFLGILGARLLNRGWRMGVLTGGAVAICGASAAIAISAVLPKNENSERNLAFSVVSVTVLSTLAMIVYPILTQIFGLSDRLAGVFLGGTIHDVAQVVGAGFSVSNETGEVATLVKLIRIAMLAPVVLVISLSVRYFDRGEHQEEKPPFLPLFVVVFLAFATLNSIGAIPDQLVQTMTVISRWALLVSIAAVGMKTSLKSIADVGSQAFSLLIVETLFIGALVLAGVMLVAE